MAVDMVLNRSRGTRIPTSLQAVFIASQRGNDVDKAPPQSMGNRLFVRTWRQKHNPQQPKPMPQQQQQWEADPASKSDKDGNRPQGHRSLKRAMDEAGTAPAPPVSMKATQPSRPAMSPQAYLDSMIRARGYSTERFKTLHTAYYNKPTALQVASYDLYLIQLVRQGNIEEFRSIASCGVSPNPCNTYGESIVHMICRLGAADFLQVLVDNGCSVRVSDDCGRTPLHDACWAANPNFELVEIILKQDKRLFHFTDNKSAVPLSYVPKQHWAIWTEFLRDKKDEFWPQRRSHIVGDEEPPILALSAPNTRPMLDPPNALTKELASMVAAGRMKPREAQMLMYDDDDDSTMEESSSDSESDDDDDEYSDISDDESWLREMEDEIDLSGNTD